MHVCKLCGSLMLLEGESGGKAGWAGRCLQPIQVRWVVVQPLVLAEDFGQEKET